MNKQFELTERDYRYLFENASDAMWVHDRQGNFLDANRAFEKMSGCTLEEWAHIRVTEFLDEAALKTAREVQRKLLNGEEIEHPYEQRFVLKDGSIRIVKMSTSPVVINGEVKGFQNVARDVTEEKRAEGMLAKITDGSPVPSFVINAEHRVAHWNAAIESLSGVSRRRVIGTDEQWRAFYRKKRPTMADLVIDGAVAIEEYYKQNGRKSRLIDGAYEAEDFFPALGENGRWLHFTGSPIKDEGGKVIAAIETLQDVTEEKQLQENMRFYGQLIIRAQEDERNRISRELHDEVSSTLLLLIQRLDAMETGNRPRLSAALKQSLEDIRSQAVAALDSLRRCAQDLRPRILDDLGLVAALEWMADDMTRNQGVATNVRVVGAEQTLPSETQLVLFRIVQEAFSNIRRHAHASSATAVMEFGPDGITISITDDGAGFKLPERIEDLAGTGNLGIMGMSERARLLGGNLEVGSEPDKGTEVVVRVPYHA